MNVEAPLAAFEAVDETIDSFEEITRNTAPTPLKRFLVGLDASQYADQAVREVARIGAISGGDVTGIHVYAAKMHDRRLKQMEGGLPDEYRKEDKLDESRETHDDLITRGLIIVSDAYHDIVEPWCKELNVPYKRESPEGRHYLRLAEYANSGDYDVLAIGILGLGAVPGGVIGGLAERTIRRTNIDTFVVKNPELSVGDGPIVVALDGSPRSFGALETALDIGRRLDVPVHAVSAFDPYYHYVAFKKIAGALSAEASVEFDFEGQEELHEEVIDRGMAKIYQSHLELAKGVAEGHGQEIVCELLDGKPYQAVVNYLERVKASLVVVGKTGIHADPNLDIGVNAENILRMAPCHVWLNHTTAMPSLDAIANETISWSEEALGQLEQVPEFARGMVRMLVLRFAQREGYTVITSAFVQDQTARYCPERGGRVEPQRPVTWSEEAARMLDVVGDPAIANFIRLRAEKKARVANYDVIQPNHVQPFLTELSKPAPPWTAPALKLIKSAADLERDMMKVETIDIAMERHAKEITLAHAEEAIKGIRERLGKPEPGTEDDGKCPFNATMKTDSGGKCPF